MLLFQLPTVWSLVIFPLLANYIRRANSASATMGGRSMRHEPEDTMRVQNNQEVWQVFENAGWNVYFDKLKGLNEEIVTEFTLNLREGSSRVCGIEIPVTEEAIAEVSGLPQNGQQWFSRRFVLPEFPEAFLQVGESIVQKGQGYDRHSLPHPWKEVEKFIMRYMTCEGRYSTIFKCHL
jgi:hypothetical protein